MARKSRTNSQKSRRLNELGDNQRAIQADCFQGISNRMTFNFHYFDNTQFFKKSYSSLTAEEFLRLGQQLIDLSEKSILEWSKERMASRNSSKFRSYGEFPDNSKYVPPKNIPEYAEWVAFRLGSTLRLCGFIVPAEHNGKRPNNEKHELCSNTFYVVFYDHDHGFYLTKKK